MKTCIKDMLTQRVALISASLWDHNAGWHLRTCAETVAGSTSSPHPSFYNPHVTLCTMCLLTSQFRLPFASFDSNLNIRGISERFDHSMESNFEHARRQGENVIVNKPCSKNPLFIWGKNKTRFSVNTDYRTIPNINDLKVKLKFKAVGGNRRTFPQTPQPSSFTWLTHFSHHCTGQFPFSFHIM